MWLMELNDQCLWKPVKTITWHVGNLPLMPGGLMSCCLAHVAEVIGMGQLLSWPRSWRGPQFRKANGLTKSRTALRIGTAANRYLSLVTCHIRIEVRPKLGLLTTVICSGPWIFFFSFCLSPDAIKMEQYFSFKSFLWMCFFCCDHKEVVNN